MGKLVPLVSAVAALLALAPGAAGTGASARESIGFVRGYANGSSLYVASLDGRHVVRLLRGWTDSSGTVGVDYYDPAWSKDGRRLAVTKYTCPAEGNCFASVELAGGRGAASAVPQTESDFNVEPSWSPDGRRVVFVDQEGSLGGPLFTWESRAKAIPLTRFPLADGSPAWSPDGSTIAFTRTSEAKHHPQRLYLVRPDGKGTRQLVRSASENPSWSPDGRRIVFDDGHRIALVDADGTSLRYLTSAATQNTDPAWSPDGHWIAFVRRRAGVAIGDIWLMNARDRSQRLLVRNAHQPAWKPG